MRYFPVFLDLAGRDVLVVGGGENAVRKVRLLTRTPAHLTVLARSFAPELVALAAQGRIHRIERLFHSADVAGKALVFAATGIAETDARIAEAARAAGVPVNVVDGPDHSSFIMPAIVDRDPVTVAIGTEGTSPVLAREIKARLEAMLPVRYGAIAHAAGRLRERIEHAIADLAVRRKFWESLLRGPFRRAALAGDEAAAEAAVARALSDFDTPPRGRVVLIGCGPGDAELLTLKAQQALQEADVLVIDRLVGADVLELARRDAERIDVGKLPGGPSASQDEINRILVREAGAGKIVARLKGGDAFVFGRAADEMAALQAAGIEVEVVPGVTAALACAARIGLPVTLRGEVRQFTVLTGAAAEGDAEHDWAALARPGAAFAIYMGLAAAPRIAERLLAAGADPATPVVVVENGTRAEERAIDGRLSDLDAIAARLRGPTIIFVGLDWARAGLTRPDRIERLPPAGRAAGNNRWTPGEIAEATHWVMG